MQTVFIRFLTQDDRVRGFYELATRARIASLRGKFTNFQSTLSAFLRISTSPTGAPPTPN